MRTSAIECQLLQVCAWHPTVHAAWRCVEAAVQLLLLLLGSVAENLLCLLEAPECVRQDCSRCSRTAILWLNSHSSESASSTLDQAHHHKVTAANSARGALSIGKHGKQATSKPHMILLAF